MLAFFTINSLIVAENVSGSIYRDSEHSQLVVSQSDMSSLQIRSATNSLPKVAASTVFCRLENQIIGAFCTNRKMPLCECLVMTLPAWLASTIAEIITDQPSPRLGHVRREFFSDVAIKFFPLRIVVEEALINVRTLRIIC
jgi:hypothetical protein